MNKVKQGELPILVYIGTKLYELTVKIIEIIVALRVTYAIVTSLTR